MAQLNASIKFDEAKGVAVVKLEPVGATEMEHELLAAYFSVPRQISLVPFGVGDNLESRFVIEDKSAFARSQRACENRIRVREGKPTVEEAWAKGKTPAEVEARKSADKAAQDAGYVDADDKARKEEGAKRDAVEAKKRADAYDGPERRSGSSPTGVERRVNQAPLRRAELKPVPKAPVAPAPPVPPPVKGPVA